MLILSLKSQTIACLAAVIQITTAAVTSQGCYADDGSLTSLGAYSYQSEGYCAGQCTSQGSAVFGMTNGDECACGNALPGGSTVASTNCNVACVGYPSDTCGGTGYYSVWLTGVGSLESDGSNSVSSSARARTTAAAAAAAAAAAQTPTTSVAPSVVYITTAIVQQGVTVIQTVMGSTTTSSTHASSSGRASQTGTSASQSKSQSEGGGGGISGGAIAGIVIGVIAALAIGALAIFFYRRRRRANEDVAGEYKRHIEPPTAGIIGSHSASLDNRLDTSMAIRRNSSESLADNQDYSRKILRVVN